MSGLPTRRACYCVVELALVEGLVHQLQLDGRRDKLLLPGILEFDISILSAMIA